jgi:hypothetical protein
MVLIPNTDPEVLQELSRLGIPIVNPQQAMAQHIKDNDVLRNFLLAIEPGNRMKVYESLVLHLKFKAKPYWWLMAGNKRKKK